MKNTTFSKMRLWGFTVFLLYQVSVLYGQTAENPYLKTTDSLYRKLEKAKTVTEEEFQKAKMLIYDMSDNAFYKDAEKYIFLFKEIADRQQNKKEIAHFYHTLGYNYKKQSLYEKSIESYQRSLELRTEIDDKRGVSLILNNLGNIYYDMGLYSLAIEAYRKNILILKELNNNNKIASALSGIGNVLSDQKRYDEALKNYREALTISLKLKDTVRLATVHTNIGEVNYLLKNYDEALNYFQKSLHYAQAIDYQYLEGYALVGIGSIYLDQGDYEKAEEFLQKSLQVRLHLKSPLEIALSEVELARLYKTTGKTDKSIDLAQKAHQISKEISFLKGEMLASELLASGYEQKGNYREALNFYKNFKTVTDSLFNFEEKKTINEYQTQIRVEKETYDLKIKQSQQKSFYNLLLISLGLLLLVIVVWVLRSRKIQRKQTEMLIRQKEMEAEQKILYSTQKERRRISQDMHDDLGTSLSGLHIYSEILTKKTTENNKEEHLKLVEMTKEITQKVRDIVWTLNNENDSLSNLTHYCSRYAENLFDNFPIRLSSDFKTEIPVIKVSGQMRKELFLCVKEALNNVLKHSEATRVTLGFAYLNEVFSITVHDNGKGSESVRKHSGNGIKNMNSRMQNIGGTFTMSSKKGTKVVFEVKIAQTGE
ncbi:MAG: tetratricopeptide repeat protein [Flavobacteriaceae bacterium]